jgi:hypothetical protein
LLLVAIVATLVLVGYPVRGGPTALWRGRYIADDLVPRINRNVDALLALKLIGTDGGHEARGMVVSDDGSLSFPGLRCQDGDKRALPPLQPTCWATDARFYDVPGLRSIRLHLGTRRPGRCRLGA